VISSIAFGATILVTLVITWWAARRSIGRDSVYAASSSISGVQNGFAIAGDFMSATTILGLTALYYNTGLDATIYFAAPFIGFFLILALVAAPLRQMGRFTLGDVVSARTGSTALRRFAAVATIVISLIYLVAQLVGAGKLISILFGAPFPIAVAIVGGLMTVYIVFGGMLAATWVQIIKAALLVAGVIALAALALARIGGFEALYERAGELARPQVFAFGGAGQDPFTTLSFAAALVFGMLGMPHLLIRLFTVPDVASARRSLVTSTFVIGVVFMLLLMVIAPAAIAFVTPDARFHAADGSIVGGPNMIVAHLASAVGGPWLFGAFSGVVLATILAVVAGLTIAIATAASHDLVGASGRISERTELWVFRSAAVIVAVCAVALAIVFEQENVAILVALAFVVAASSTFPVLILAIYWEGLNAVGALAGGIVGLATSVALIIVGPAVWVLALGHDAPIFPSDYPTLLTMPLAFVLAIVASKLGASAPKLAVNDGAAKSGG
jgi:cation/acetate symporter